MDLNHIKLTALGDTAGSPETAPVYVFVEKITAIVTRSDGGSKIYLSGVTDVLRVKETYEQIVDKIENEAISFDDEEDAPKGKRR